MARRQFKIPFAATGDTESIPNETQPDGSVSMQQGYGYDYERDPQTDPLAKVFPRDVHNGILNEITASIGEIQQQGYPIWVTVGAPYPINAVVRHNGQNWQSNIATNNDEPGVGPGATSWKVAGSSVEKFNAPIATIASGATVNLTTGAPNTSQITITGTASISAFTVAAGRAFVVKFAGACTLVNSGSLVTGTGSNITTVAGDSCIIRATADNTVELLNYARRETVAGKNQCTAWVNFNAVGTVAIRDSYNVSSITTIANGKFSINFATNMDNSNYAAMVTCSSTDNSSNNISASILTQAGVSKYDETGFSIICEVSSGSNASPEMVSVFVFGGK